MAAARKPAVKMDAIGMLVADHKKAQKAFKDFEKLKKSGGKRGESDIVRQTYANLAAVLVRRKAGRVRGRADCCRYFGRRGVADACGVEAGAFPRDATRLHRG